MVQSEDSNKVNRGVHTTEPFPNRSTSGEDEQSVRLPLPQVPKSILIPDNYKEQTMEETITTSDFPEDFTESSEAPQRNLYEMRPLNRKYFRASPATIEFKLYRTKRGGRRMKRSFPNHLKKDTNQKRVCIEKQQKQQQQQQKSKVLETQPQQEETSFIDRLKNSFNKMRKPNLPKKDTAPIDENPIDEYIERMDIYYFDHGNSAYFRTTDCPPQILSEMLANQTTHYATRFWAEIFGTLHIGMSFLIAFFMQAYRFLLYSMIRPIIVGFLQMTSDYLLKPILTIIFNGLLQPPFILLYNVFSSIQDMLRPIAAILDNFLKPIAGLFRAIRLINFTNRKEIIRTTQPQSV